MLIVYWPLPTIKPKNEQNHRATEVVSPLIWLRELNTMELLERMAVAIIVAHERYGIFVSIYRSSNIHIHDEKDISTKVLSPAECLLLDLSYPTVAVRIMTINSLKIME